MNELIHVHFCSKTEKSKNVINNAHIRNMRNKKKIDDVKNIVHHAGQNWDIEVIQIYSPVKEFVFFIIIS